MALNNPVEEGKDIYGSNYITSARLFVLIAFASLWIYRYSLRSAKYRVPLYIDRPSLQLEWMLTFVALG